MKPLLKQQCLRTLSSVFGLSDFRPGQKKAVETLLQGRDLFCLFPTGAGKSLCYQLPAVLMERITLVVSPLISLMRDQASSLQAKGIPALCLDSLQTEWEQTETMAILRSGTAKLLYVSPERLLSPAFVRICQELSPSMVVVDEAHCVLQWGEHFRPAYNRIAAFIYSLPNRPVLCAMTATADRKMRRGIIQNLGMKRPAVLTLPLLRENLIYQAVPVLDSRGWLLSQAEQGGKGVVFCRTRKACEQLGKWLMKALPAEAVGVYHAGMERGDRLRMQEDFISGRTRILVATSAFGMGVDVPDIRWVVHDSLPDTITDWAQQSGRAGRDGRPSKCVLLISEDALNSSRLYYARHRIQLKGKPLRRLFLYRDWTDQKKVLKAALQARCIPQAIGASFGQRLPRCGRCSACRSRIHLPGGTVPNLFTGSERELHEWWTAFAGKKLSGSHKGV